MPNDTSVNNNYTSSMVVPVRLDPPFEDTGLLSFRRENDKILIPRSEYDACLEGNRHERRAKLKAFYKKLYD